MAILGDKVTLDTVNKLNTLLNEDLPIPYYFDVLDYKNLSNLNLKKHIDKEGKIIYVK